MKRIVFALILFGTFASLSCSKGPDPSPPPKTTSLSSEPLTATETPELRQYVIEDLKGSALIFEEGSTQGEKATEEEVVESGDEIITKAKSELTLALGEETLVRVPANSDLKVDQLMPNGSKGFISRLKLIEGKVLCEVEKLTQTQSNFEVSAGGVICGVRGTAFEVQKQGQSVQTNTFHGMVEMKKGTVVRQVSANQHQAFSFKSGGFSSIRSLYPDERNKYRTWTLQRNKVLEKRAKRMAVLRSIANLPSEDRAQLSRDVSKAKPRERVKKLRQLLQKTYIPEPNIKPKNKGKQESGAKPYKKNQKLDQGNLEKNRKTISPGRNVTGKKPAKKTSKLPSPKSLKMHPVKKTSQKN